MKNKLDFIQKLPLWQFLKETQTPVYIFFITRIALFFAVYTGLLIFMRLGAKPVSGPFAENLFLFPWAKWDAAYYAEIAKSGYYEFRLAAFPPLYPFLTHIIDILFNDAAFSGIVTANLAFLIGLIIFYKLVLLKFGERGLAERATFYLSIFPTSFFFSCGLSESTFLLMSVAAFYFAEKENWLWAGISGILTAMTRSVGFLIAFPLALIYFHKRQFDIKKIKADILCPFLAPIGLLLFMGILILYGKAPLDFIHAGQQMWPRIFAFPGWDWWRAFETLASYDLTAILAGNYPVLMAIGFTLVSLFLVLALSLFKTEPSYALHALLLILFALSNPAKEWILYGDMRFILVAFPIYIALAQFGKNKIVNGLIITLSITLLTLFALYNGMGGWIS